MKKDNVSIVIIDDDRTNNIICENMLKKLRISQDITSFQSIEEGLAFLENSFRKGLFPDVIFLDLRFPESDKDAWYFLEIYPKLLAQYPQAKTLLYVLTSSIAKKDMKRVENYSFVHGFISKPLSEEKLAKFFL
ncbi:MAG: response regulator [Bacteroidia bacterium]|nr:response regulator [Bacteroidia bacterium]MDW8300851.1 response regulator [Bacteroidia bacterium]